MLDSFIVKGNSMAPAIQAGDYVFVNKMAFRREAGPERKDIVVGKFRHLEGITAIKRVIGLSGEWVFIEKGEIFVAPDRDGERTPVGRLDSESYMESLAEDFSYRLDPYEYFLIGDNGLNSVDSRELGPADIYSLRGRVVKVFRPQNMSFVDF